MVRVRVTGRVRVRVQVRVVVMVRVQGWGGLPRTVSDHGPPVAVYSAARHVEADRDLGLALGIGLGRSGPGRVSP